MIGFTQLAQWGRLGNQMWQIAFLVGLYKSHRVKYMIPQWEYARAFKYQFPQGELPSAQVVQERGHLWQPFVLNPKLNYDFRGYFQSSKYFAHCEAAIRHIFDFKEEISAPLLEKYATTDAVSVHVRRGDYVGNPNYVQLGREYYEAALRQFESKPILLFSDDLDYARELIPTGVPVDENEIDSLCLMSKCPHHVVANSSFSFWGAWLANTPNVIRPKEFYLGRLKTDFPLHQYYPPEWKAL